MKYFTIVGSRILRLNSKYCVSVTSHGYVEPQNFKIGVIGQDESKGEYKVVTLSGDDSQIIEFELKNQEIENHFLDAQSVDGEKFEGRINLNLNTERCSVFVQTDKSIYKPSDKVQFRVLLLDIDTKPFESSKVEIYVTDGAQNRVKQFLNPKFVKGVFQDELQLSDAPVMGDWNIHVKAQEMFYEATKQFEVAEYVLPTFEVIIDANPHVLFDDGKVHATVSGKYTFGKLAKGKATVTAKIDHLWSDDPLVKVSKVVDVEGRKDVEFDIGKELELSIIEDDVKVEIEATFVEELTGREHTASSSVTIHDTPHVIDLRESSEKVKPGLPFKVTAFVKFHDGTPVFDDANPVEFKIISYYAVKQPKGRSGWRSSNQERSEHRTENRSLVKGIASVSVVVPPDVTGMQFEAKYLDTEDCTRTIRKSDSTSGHFVQARVLTHNPKIGNEVSVNVVATEELSSITFQIISHSHVIMSKTIAVAGSKSVDFTFMPTDAMAPKAELLIYYLRPDGEIVSDHLQIPFGFQLHNFVKIDLSREESKPGEEINITVNANPNSLVGLLGVDQSVIILKSGNDIEKSAVVDAIEKYDDSHRGNTCEEYFCNFPITDFDESQVVLITNAMSKNQKLNLERWIDFRSMLKKRTFKKAAMPVEMDEIVEIGEPDWTDLSSTVPVRKTFPETWIFDTLDLVDGESVLTKKVPDTITSWIITGFAVDPATGLGLTSQPQKLNVFQPFFVSTNLPYSIKRGEVVKIPVIVFNYLENVQDVEVTMFNSNDEFEFMKDAKKMTKLLQVEPNVAASVSFTIKPTQVGNIKIKILAVSAVAGDGIEKMLLVEPEGVTQYMNKALFIDLRSVHEFKTNFDIVIPENAVPDSTKIEVSAIGDLLGPSITNLDKLIRIPYGCGEQNMLNFVPNIVVLEYLTVLNKLTPEIAQQAKNFMESGYQRELTFKHDDGSYSAFGPNDKSGSTWLTAFVAKSFHQAAKHIQVDNGIVTQALSFLSNVQDANGSFPEVGTVIQTSMQGGSSKGLGLTAYVLITFLENEVEIKNYQKPINKALQYIVGNSENLVDNYSLSIVAYALQLAKHSLKDSMLNNLNSKAEDFNGLKHWAKVESKADDENPWNSQPNAMNIEMTAYALQALLEAGEDTETIPIMRWLVSQRNENGGFQSTQDTVVGLQALSKLAQKIFVPDCKLDIALKCEGNVKAKLEVNSENALILQKYELPSSVQHFEASASGRGFGILQLSYKFNISESGEYPRFILEPEVIKQANKNFLFLIVTTNFLADDVTKKSNMAVMEVSFPSGFSFDSDHIKTLKEIEKVKRVETKDGETVVVVYFDDVDTTKLQLEFKAIRTHNVAELKPAPVLIYDYYDNSRRASTFYNAPPVSLSDISTSEE